VRRKKFRNRKFGQEKNSPDVVMRASGATGTDTRLPSREAKIVGGSSISVPQQDPSMNVQVRFTQRSLAYLAAGFVIRAMQHGWGGSAAGGNSFAAFRYLLDAFKASVTGTFPALQSAPLWFWETNMALMPKTERFKTGRVVYTGFNLDDGQGVDQNMVMGTLDYSYSIFWGEVTPASLRVNGYPILAPQSPYLIAEGEEAIQSLFEFFEEKGLCKRSSAPDPKDLWMTHDTSAFATVYAEMGASYFAPGGMATTLSSERRIGSPIFSKFGPYQDAEFLWRGFFEYHRGTGTPFYIGPRLMELTHQKQIRNKVAPIFKWINFDEIFEILSLTLCLAIEENFKGTAVVPIPCPLTSQQVQIMLRQAILPLFSNEMAQDLRLESPAWIPLLPFVVGPNGIAQGNSGSGPMLPFFLAENLRCMKRVTAVLKNTRNPAQPSTMELDIVPILCRPSPAIIPQLGNYTLEAGGTFSLYTVIPPLPDPEVPINLIDASCVVGPVTNYLDLNADVQPLLVSSWNTWIQQYSGTLASLVQLSTDRGCAALCVLPYTNQLRLLSPEALPPVQPQGLTTTGLSPSKDVQGKVLKKQGSKKSFGLSIEHLRRRVGAAPAPGSSEVFRHIANAGTSSTLGFTSELWKYLGHWVLPTALTVSPIFESTLAAYMTNVIEPIYLPSSASFSNFGGTDGQPIFPLQYDRHLQFAADNVRAYNSPVESEMEIEFKSLTAKGDGGFFTKIAGIIGESLGIHGSGQFMDSIGDLTGL